MSISIDKTRQAIGENSKKYTDLQLREIVDVFTVLCDLSIDSFLEKRNNQKLESQTITLNEN